MRFEAWNEALRVTCGHFQGVPERTRRLVDGHFRRQSISGLDVANFACDLRHIERTRRDVRNDHQEHLYLLFQIAGLTRVEIGETRRVLQPGNLFLLDSTSPSRMEFSGERSHCVSLHLPRAALLSGASRALRIGRVHADDQRDARWLRQRIVAGLARVEQRSDPEFLLELARVTFVVDGDGAPALPDRSSQRSRYQFALREIELQITSPNLSLGWLAATVGISERQLERDFAAHDTSYIRSVRDQRLKLARDLMKLAKRSGRSVRVTDLAYSSGFRDLSNFNRAFKAGFGVTPREYMRRVGPAADYPVSSHPAEREAVVPAGG